MLFLIQTFTLFNSTSASTFIFHHVRAAIVFSDLAPFTSSSSILNKNGATFTHLSASPSHTSSYIIRSRLRHSSSLLNSTYRKEVRYSFNGVDVARNLENPHFPGTKLILFLQFTLLLPIFFFNCVMSLCCALILLRIDEALSLFEI
ncbi:unnamed protein product [Vicia faba]|uniref:Transmembrane protein n=1 Tax=Vicia faba TaxID=3906 RepID=A0AAV1B7S4_VICFA|nr:unnamed protein product [Vicia faba]